jgi:hypothetical protein
MRDLKLPQLYPLYVVTRPDGRPYVRCVDLVVAKDHARDVRGTITLEARQIDLEQRFSTIEKAAIDLLYASFAA